MKLNKEYKGITLVALVITIIILLILAGITISQLTQNGLFEKTKLAKQKSENAEIRENKTLEEYENKVGEYIDGSRQNGSVPVGPTVIWSHDNDEKGVLYQIGDTRTFTGYNVNDFDAVIVDAGYPPPADEGWPNLQSLYISKIDFNEAMNGILSSSSTWSGCSYSIKIDSTNNQIVYVAGGHAIKKVIGIKY